MEYGLDFRRYSLCSMNGLSLFSGIGGLDAAFNWAGGNILAFCEIDNFCQKVLRKHWPHVPIFNDIHTLTKEAIINAGITTAVDVIYGGFPCQPFSVAGNQKGQNDNRYLWPEFSRLVAEIKPRWVIAENVPGILNISADSVCQDLERQNYSVGIGDFEAAAVGAQHRRERIFFVAHSRCKLLQGCTVERTVCSEHETKTSAVSKRPGCSFTANSDCKQCKEQQRKEQQQSFGAEQTFSEFRCYCGRVSQSCMGRGFNGFPKELDGSLSPTATGIPNRTKRLKALGNAVVPQQAYPVFKAVIDADKQIQQEV